MTYDITHHGRMTKTAIVFGILFVCYILIGFLIAPPLVRHFAGRYLQEHFSAESSWTGPSML